MKLSLKQRNLVISKAIRMIKLYSMMDDHNPHEGSKAAYIMMIADVVPLAEIDAMHYEAMTKAYDELENEQVRNIPKDRTELLKPIFESKNYN